VGEETVSGITTIYIGKLYECAGRAAILLREIHFAGGQRAALKQVSNGVVDDVHPDHLGTTSVVTSSTGV